MIFSKANRQQFYYFSLCLVAFSIPLLFLFSSISVIILCVSWLLTGDFKEKIKWLKERKMLWVWIGFYLLHAVSYLYSEDKEQSSFDLQRKLSLIGLPLVIGAATSIPGNILSRVIKTFIVSVTLVGIIFLVRVTYIYFQTGESYFFYHELVKGSDTNAVYIAWYYFFSLTALLLFDWGKMTRTGNWLFGILVIFQTIFFLLLSSKSLIILFLILSFPAYVIKEYHRKEHGTFRILILCMTGLLFVGLLFFTKNPIRTRYLDILTQKEPKIENNQMRRQFNNLTLRLFLWKTGIENLNDHNLWWYGCGNGDLELLQQEKIRQYENQLTSHDVQNEDIASYNMHNMFMQSLVTLGIPGLALFMIIIIAPFIATAKSGEYWIAAAFHIPSFCFMMQEAALQTHAGVMFFGFFSMLFWNYYYNNSAKQMKTNPAM